MASSPGSQPPPWGGIQKSTTLMCFQELRKRDQILSHCFYHSGSLRVWGSCEPGTVDEGHMYVYIYLFIYLYLYIFQFSCSVVPMLCDPMDCSTPEFAVLHQLLELAQTCIHRVGDTIQLFQFSVVSFSRLQSFPASGSFPRSQFFTSGGQSIGASVSVLPMNIQGWFPLGLTGWISLQSKGLSRVPTPIPQLKASILWHSAFFVVHLSHPYTTTGKTIALTSKVIWPLLAK